MPALKHGDPIWSRKLPPGAAGLSVSQREAVDPRRESIHCHATFSLLAVQNGEAGAVLREPIATVSWADELEVGRTRLGPPMSSETLPWRNSAHPPDTRVTLQGRRTTGARVSLLSEEPRSTFSSHKQASPRARRYGVKRPSQSSHKWYSRFSS